MNDKKSNIVNKILEAIRNKEIKMKPKIYFVLKAVLAVLAIIVIALFVLYLISFIAFNMRLSGIWYLPGFGFPALRDFFILLPWLLISAALGLIIVLEIFVKHFTFAFRQPILYSLLAIIILVLLGNFIIARTFLHPYLFLKAREGRFPIPIGESVYRGERFNNVHRGIVSKINDNGFTIETYQKESLDIITFSLPKIEVKENDEVVVFGKRDDGKVNAFEIRLIDDNIKEFFHQRRMMPGRAMPNQIMPSLFNR